MSRIPSFALDVPPISRRRLDIAEPESALPRRPIAFFLVHGGGWHGGRRQQYYPVMRYFNALGHTAAATGYRLRGRGVTVFDQLLDVRQSYDAFRRYLRRTADAPPEIVVMGSSAGAHLASLLAYARPGECGEPSNDRNRLPAADGWQPPAGAVLVCAPGRMTPWRKINPEIWQSMQEAVGTAYTPETEPLFVRVSASTYLDRDPCPTFLVGSENEIYFPHFMLREWRRKMIAAGRRCELKIYAGQSHGFLYGCRTPGQREALSDIVRFAASLAAPTA